ncbi:hypothetical protein [Nocardioides sp. zg-1228]|uniref:hypothetical protein n=1 Tax=Nocardioides sp. zg-1228 TaxID=2763008 RepID=UPI00164362DC|nr:hypothetical protein [Nocardioides sp. zg-1228]MBC2932088.1 hypothetical protein [Nocardioides sp. zg-1228]QSF57636.1 hypothetical protein JX575_19270 [Nocardioides sp. zg-1228]
MPVPGRRDGPAVDRAPVGSELGIPAELRERGELRRQSLTDVDGARFDEPLCGSGRSDPFTEIITTVETGRSGAYIDRVDVSYDVGGRLFTLSTSWSYVVCGDAITEQDIC